MTALPCLQCHVGQTRTYFRTQEVVLDLELLMDPTLGQLSADWSSSIETMPSMALKLLASCRLSLCRGQSWVANQLAVTFLDVQVFLTESLLGRRLQTQESCCGTAE
jgi:hypothetical protein